MFGLQLGRLGIAGSLFNERALWPLGASSPGLWIDPPYTASLFQDSAGTTAISAIGTVLDSANPVGLALDRKGNLELGPELVTNGDGSSLTGWTLASSGNAVVVDGKFRNTVIGAPSNSGGYRRQITTVVGNTYFLSVEISPISMPNGNAQVSIYSDAAFTAELITIRSTDAFRTGYFKATTTSTMVYWACGASSSTTTVADFDNISVKEIPGIHLSQATARPVASARVNLLTYTEDFSASGWGGATVVIGATVTGPTGLADAKSISTTGGGYWLCPSTKSGPSLTGSLWVRRVSGTDAVSMGSPENAHTPIAVTTSWQKFTRSSASSSSGTSDSYLGFSFAAGGANVIEVAQPQLNLGSTDLPYQRVGAAGDYDASAGPTYLQFDGVDDSLASATFAAGTLTSSMDCMIAVRRDSVSGVCLIGLWDPDNTARWIGAAESGIGTSCVNGSGSPTVWVDGVQLSGGTAVTRGTLYTALTAGAWHILEFRGLDLANWTKVAFSGYSSALVNGALGKIELFASGQDANRDRARARMAAYFGVTLA